jgi:NitT/TauT family transport system permease protein
MRSLPVPVLTALIVLLGVAAWELASLVADPQTGLLPSPATVFMGLVEELRNGRLLRDLGSSLARVAVGFALAVCSAVPLGLWIGARPRWCGSLMPLINFFRNISPLAWIPFAILWFGIGHAPAIFLIFMSTFFPLLMATIAAIGNLSPRYVAIAREYGFGPAETTIKVTLPAILPHLLISLRVAAGIAWMVIVAAEMIAGRDGLGFAIIDARNGLRQDLLVSTMVVIGATGVLIDRAIAQLHHLPALRWAHA